MWTPFALALDNTLLFINLKTAEWHDPLEERHVCKERAWSICRATICMHAPVLVAQQDPMDP
eukprot:scaffold2224_cov154-Amphora_coffeaeformis.AAC.1